MEPCRLRSMWKDALFLLWFVKPFSLSVFFSVAHYIVSILTGKIIPFFFLIEGKGKQPSYSLLSQFFNRSSYCICRELWHWEKTEPIFLSCLWSQDTCMGSDCFWMGSDCFWMSTSRQQHFVQDINPFLPSSSTMTYCHRLLGTSSCLCF